MLEIDNESAFKDGLSADFEQDQTLNFTLRATNNQSGSSIDQEFVLNVLDDTSGNNVNSIPVFTSNPSFGHINGIEYFTFPTDLPLGSVGIISSITKMIR